MIMVVMDADGTLSVDYEKIYDFKQGEVWRSSITPGTHIVTLTNGDLTWKQRIENQSGKQLLVETNLQEQVVARAERKRIARPAEISLADEKSLTARQGTLKDPRDGQVYKTIKIGNHVWMAENLNYTITDSWCYENSQTNCQEYGRLYTWESAKKGCPTGWHLPTDSEWSTLINNNGGERKADAKLKEGGSSGFNASLGGFRNTDGEFRYVGEDGNYWSSSASGEYDAWVRFFHSGSDKVNRFDYSRDYGLSVRCLQD